MITAFCVVVAFITLLLTFAGGDRLKGNTGGSTTPVDAPSIDPRDPFYTRPFRSHVGIVPRDLLAIILAVLSCLIMFERMAGDVGSTGRWIGLAISLAGFYNGSVTAGEFFMAGLRKRAAVALLGFIMSATAAAFFIWVGRGIGPY